MTQRARPTKPLPYVKQFEILTKPYLHMWDLQCLFLCSVPHLDTELAKARIKKAHRRGYPTREIVRHFGISMNLIAERAWAEEVEAD